MEIINKEVIENLSKKRSKNSISIYLPTYREDPETKENRNRINLKNKIKAARQELEDQRYKENEIEEYLKPLNDIMKDAGFLRNLGDGLAIFLNENTFEYYRLPLNFDSILYMGNDFYLLSLLRPVRENKSFYILSLNLHGVKLYKADRFSIEEEKVEAFVPEKIEEVTGFDDYRNKVYQHSSALVGGGQTFYQGHARGEEEKKQEVKRFLRYVEDGLQTILQDKTEPLVVASVDYIFSLFSDTTRYKHLMSKNISENPADETPTNLLQKAWQVMQEQLDQEHKEMVQKYRDASNKSYMIDDIVPNILYNRVHTLFVNKKESIWGSVHNDTFEVMRHAERQDGDEDLLNYSAIRAFLNNGNVYLMEPEEMPDQNKALNALYRF